MFLVTLTALFRVQSPTSADLGIVNNDAHYTVTILHDRQGRVDFEVLRRVGTSEVFSVVDGDTLTLIVRREEAIVAHGLYEIRVGLAGEHGTILVPLSGAWMIVDPVDLVRQARAFDNAVDRVLADSMPSMGMLEVQG